MPWEIKRTGREFCVVKQDTGEKVPGGCHPSREKALAHMRALYANTDEPSRPRPRGGDHGRLS